MSQLDLALEAGVSARHLSFVETGRSQAQPRDGAAPGRAARRAAARPQPAAARRRATRPRTASARSTTPEMRPGARRARARPAPATSPTRPLVVDREWELRGRQPRRSALLDRRRRRPQLLEPPVNVLRLSLHPDGVAPRIANLAEWRAHLLERLRPPGRRSTGDPALAALLRGARAATPRPTPRARPGGQRHRRAAAAAHRATASWRSSARSPTFGTAVDITRRGAGDRVVLPGRRRAPPTCCGRWSRRARRSAARSRRPARARA